MKIYVVFTEGDQIVVGERADPSGYHRLMNVSELALFKKALPPCNVAKYASAALENSGWALLSVVLLDSMYLIWGDAEQMLRDRYL
jgi:hypothetical protein